MRALALSGLLVAAGLLFSACPLPNNYTTTSVFPQADFDAMLGMYWIPGDPSHAVVVTQDGVIWRVSTADAAEQPTVFLDLRDRLLPRLAGEEGLLGFVFAPDYATSGRLFVHYTGEGGGRVRGDGQSRQGVIARFRGDTVSADPDSEKIILKQPQPFTNHNGGGLAFGPDGYLYITFGDGGGGGDPLGNAQNLNTMLGKILRIDVSGDSYKIPPDNPFAGGNGDVRREIWAYGLRNPWRITFDRGTGTLWIGDVGQAMWEEVNVGVKGGNYGWNALEGFHCYEAASCDGAQTVQPVAEYSHDFGCAIVGGSVYRGSAMPELVGWYVYGDFCSGKVWALHADGDPTAPIPIADTGKMIASFAEDPDGELYLVTFDNTIEKLVRK